MRDHLCLLKNLKGKRQFFVRRRVKGFLPNLRSGTREAENERRGMEGCGDSFKTWIESSGSDECGDRTCEMQSPF